MSTYVLMAGLPGTGKSTVAKALAQEVGGFVLSKDTVRAALFPGELTDYSREQDDLCFGMVLDGAAYLASRRRNGCEFFFLDGRTFSRTEQIERTIEAAGKAGCGWRILRAICPDEVAAARLVADAATHPAANRTVEMYREVKARFEPIYRPHLEIDTSQPIEVCVRQAVAWLGVDQSTA